jgi:hypothetical protein
MSDGANKRRGEDEVVGRSVAVTNSHQPAAYSVRQLRCMMPIVEVGSDR